MSDTHEWMPNTLFDMAAFCDKNGMEKAKTILIESASLLYICLANQAMYKAQPETPDLAPPALDRGLGFGSGAKRSAPSQH